MGVDQTGHGPDSEAKNAEKPSAKDTTWRPPHDRPGAPGQRSRLESKAAAAGREVATEQQDDKDDEQPSPAGEKPAAEAEKETESDDRLREDRAPTAAVPNEDAEGQTDEDRSNAQTEKNADEPAELTAEDRPGPEQPPQDAEASAEQEPDEAPATDARPEPEGEPEAQDEFPPRGEAPPNTAEAGTNEPGDAMRAKLADHDRERPQDRPQEGSDQTDDPQGEGAGDGTENSSGDEPGSWRGRGNQYLNYEENYAVERVLGRLRDREAGITDELRAQEAETAGIQLVGLEHRLKGEGRFKEKVAQKLAAELRKSPVEAAESVSDALRYTYRIPRASYVQGYGQVADGLTRQGHEMVFCRNSWDGAEYKGVNTRWRTPGGQLIEIQFHTPESFDAKQLKHWAYERQRDPLTGGQEREEMKRIQEEVSAGIPIPPGVGDIADYRKEGY